MADRTVSGDTSLRVAVVDADSGFVQVLSKRAERVGWDLRVHDGPLAVDELVALRVHALVVDPALYGSRGLEAVEAVCSGLPGLAVVVCTGPSSVAERVRGLRLGADDWLTKPCHPEELLARVEAVVRRRRRAEGAAEGPVLAGELEIRPDRFQAFVAGRSIELTRREFELVSLLAAAEGQVLEREDVYQRVWGYAMARGDRSVDVFVRKLRLKLRRASPGWRYIHTHFGVGYRFAPEPVEGPGAVQGAGVDEAPEASAGVARQPVTSAG